MVHYQDHARMLQVLRRRLAALREGELLPQSFVGEVFSDFESHANLYDVNYADRLAAALA